MASGWLNGGRAGAGARVGAGAVAEPVPVPLFSASKDPRLAAMPPRPEPDQVSVVSDADEGAHGQGALSQILLGSSPAVTRALAGHPMASCWALAHWVHAVLRATGAPCFLNNPFSGALILVAMAVDDNSGPGGAGATLLGASCALLVAAALLGERDGLAGLCFNGALIGVTLGSGTALNDRPWLLGAIVSLSAISAWLSRGLAAAFSRVNLPALNVAFNVLVALWTAVEASWIPADREPPPAFPANVSTVDWGLVATGVLMAPGPVYACTSISSCCILYVAFLIFSPMLFLVSILGAAVGTLLGVALCPATELASLYAGLWGYCPLLTACALASVFFVFNAQSVALALVGAAVATLTYGALDRALQPLGLPVLAWPFVLSTWMLVANPQTSLGLTPVPLNELATPEEARTRAQQRQQLLLEMQPLQPAMPAAIPVAMPLPRQQAGDPIFRH